jgi:hypothetical protein
MAKQTTAPAQNTGSANPNTDDAYPSVIVPGNVHVIDDAGAYGDERGVPQIVQDDNKGWG